MTLLDGRVALVTGGSRGLGRAICIGLAREGATVAFNYARSDADAEATVAAVAAVGGKATAHKISVLDKPGLAELVRMLDRAHGKIDILVNNAGFGQVVPLALMEEEDWDAMLDTHVKGAFLATQAVLRTMVRERYGRIVNVGSLAGIKMMQAPVHYATAKAALKGFTEALAKEVGRYGITVNCVAPGILDEGVSDHLPPARKEEYLRHCALRRVGQLDEAATVIAFVASERNSYMNGATIVVDGAV
ncbi:MAG TPA: SDR family NAD(P)-dependent oxidoreductase [Kofleriaceae bacterium]|nr:SDR family NAD(P)-dependent oxidoreductase [Kofleriaceae bacterium]